MLIIYTQYLIKSINEINKHSLIYIFFYVHLQFKMIEFTHYTHRTTTPRQAKEWNLLYIYLFIYCYFTN